MADVYLDQVDGSDSNDGSSWVQAYLTLAKALDGTELAAGETLWVQKNNATSGSVTLRGLSAFSDNPIRVIGVKSGTSATPPGTSDIILGLRNGSGTRAYAQVSGEAAPIFTTTVAGSDLNLGGFFGLIYGLVLKASDDFNMISVESYIPFEECEIRCGNGDNGQIFIGFNSKPFGVHLKNCKMSSGGSIGNLRFNNKGAGLVCEATEIDLTNTAMIEPGSGSAIFDSCDFSAQSGVVLDSAGGDAAQGVIQLNNCKLHASTVPVSGSVAGQFRSEFTLTSSVGSKGTGASFQEFNIISNNGNIVEELTGVRDGGGDDGGTGGWSLAYTPLANGTRNNLTGLVGPWMHKKVAGDGTSQDLTIFIANDEGVDYQTDDVHAEVLFPSAVGDANYDFETTQLDLAASPGDVTDDAVSSWTAPAANAQKFVIAISPDYTGRLKWRVVFTRNFSSPKTLFVDGLATLT